MGPGQVGEDDGDRAVAIVDLLDNIVHALHHGTAVLILEKIIEIVIHIIGGVRIIKQILVIGGRCIICIAREDILELGIASSLLEQAADTKVDLIPAVGAGTISPVHLHIINIFDAVLIDHDPGMQVIGRPDASADRIRLIPQPPGHIQERCRPIEARTALCLEHNFGAPEGPLGTAALPAGISGHIGIPAVPNGQIAGVQLVLIQKVGRLAIDDAGQDLVHIGVNRLVAGCVPAVLTKIEITVFVVRKEGTVVLPHIEHRPVQLDQTGLVPLDEITVFRHIIQPIGLQSVLNGMEARSEIIQAQRLRVHMAQILSNEDEAGLNALHLAQDIGHQLAAERGVDDVIERPVLPGHIQIRQRLGDHIDGRAVGRAAAGVVDHDYRLGPGHRVLRIEAAILIAGYPALRRQGGHIAQGPILRRHVRECDGRYLIYAHHAAQHGHELGAGDLHIGPESSVGISAHDAQSGHGLDALIVIVYLRHVGENRFALSGDLRLRRDQRAEYVGHLPSCDALIRAEQIVLRCHEPDVFHSHRGLAGVKFHILRHGQCGRVHHGAGPIRPGIALRRLLELVTLDHHFLTDNGVSLIKGDDAVTDAHRLLHLSLRRHLAGCVAAADTGGKYT